MKTAFSTIRRLLVILGGAALLVMMLHITVEVILRSAFNITIPGTIEFVSFYYMVCAVFAGLAIVALLDEQVVVEILLKRLPARPLSIVDCLAAALGAAYAGFLADAAWLEAKTAFKFGEMVPVRGFDVPVWPSRWVAVTGLAIIALASAAYAIVHLLGRKVPKS